MLELQDIEKSLAGKPVLRKISLQVQPGEILVLLGPSGCGKTTLLRIVAGLETPDGGSLLLDGQDFSRLPIHRRNFGLVFQDFALFPHKNVLENISFGLKMSGWEDVRAASRAAEVLELVGLAGFEQRSVQALSGGEQQRVALARSLAPAPQLLLLDEPLGSLDRALRERLMNDLRPILRLPDSAGRPMTSVYVTHDQTEAFALADRVAVMRAGRIEQTGRPAEIYRAPRTPFVARFLGMENLFSASLEEGSILQTELGSLQYRPAGTPAGKEQVTILIRPGAGYLPAPGEPAENELAVRILERSFRGRYQVAWLEIISESAEVKGHLKLEFDSAVRLPPRGESLRLALDPEKIGVLE